MNDLTIPKDGKNKLTACAVVSTPLWLLLSDEGLPADEAVTEIVSTPGMLAEIRERLPMLEAQLQPCGDTFVGAKLGEWSLVFDPGARAEAASFWEPYKRALGDLPAEALTLAMQDYERQPDAQFMPKPGPLRALALRRLAPLYCAIGRARRALKAPAPRQFDPAMVEERRAFIQSLGLGKRKSV